MERFSNTEISWKERLDRYSRAIAALEESPQPQVAQLLEVLLARDAIAAALKLKSNLSGDDLIQLATLDSQLKAEADRFGELTANLERWRSLAEPEEDAWWWPQPKPTELPRWAQLTWLWNGLSIVFLTVSASLILNTASRFWGGGVASAGTLVVVGQSVLTLIAGRGALTQAGRQAWGDFLKLRQVSDHQKQIWGTVGAGSVLLLTSGIHASLPWMATGYNRWGEHHYAARRLGNALRDYQTALSLRPDYAIAHFNLGLAYEDLQQTQQAKVEYQAVVQSNPDQTSLEVWLGAHNNLSRLHLLTGNDVLASSLLIQAIDRLPENLVDTSPELAALNYALHKNLGWVRLEQGRYRDAQTRLEFAIAADSEVDVKQAAAHCLLAQVLDAQNQPTAAEAEWGLCLTWANPGNPDEDDWIGIYERREQEATSP